MLAYASTRQPDVVSGLGHPALSGLRPMHVVTELPPRSVA
jgi:hypothetical protein